jgi:WD40 repeat protein
MLTRPRYAIVALIGVFLVSTRIAVAATVAVPIENPAMAPSDRFGNAVSISGGQLAVGAALDNTTGLNSGRAYLFDPNTTALIHTFENPSPGTSERFGQSVGVSGTRVLVGADRDATTGTNSGRAYVFDAVGGGLVHTLENPAAATSTESEFGGAVSIAGDRILIGAIGDDTTGTDSGRAYLFDAVTGSLVYTFENPAPAAGDEFGISVSVSGDRLLVGAHLDDTTAGNAGRAYLFDAATGSLVHTFENPDPGSGDHFGNAVSVSGDRVLIGAHDDNTTGSNSGRAYVFDAATGNLVHTLDNPAPDAGDRFGNAVSVAGDQVLIGALEDDTTGTNSGRAYLFDALSGSLVDTFDNPALHAGDRFGNAVSVTSDGMAVGAYTDGTLATASGRVYTYIDGIQAAIDIAPEDITNTLHPHHNGGDLNDSIPLVVFGSEALDVDLIDTATLAFGPAEGAIDPASTPVVQDYDEDLVLDLRLEFLTGDTGIGCSQFDATLTGQTTEGDYFAGTDFITPDCDASCH